MNDLQRQIDGTSPVSQEFHPFSTTMLLEDNLMKKLPAEASSILSHDFSNFLLQSLVSLSFEDEEELRLVQTITDDDDPYDFDISFRSLFEMTHESLVVCADEEQEEPLLSRESHQVIPGRIMMTSNKKNHESMAASSTGLKRTAHGRDDDCSCFSSKDESAARQKRPRRITDPPPPPPPSAVSVPVSSCCADSSVSSRSAVSHHDGWSAKVQELQQFKLKHGHSSVPFTSSNDEEGTASLARWVKRQRHQYKRKMKGQPSTMTDERIAQLEDTCDFVWDSHQEAFQRRLNELAEFKATYGHTVVTSTTTSSSTTTTTKYDQQQPNVGLATWCKCQRQQYRLFVQGKPSNLSRERIQELERLEFDWNPQHPPQEQGRRGRPRRASPS
jgi:Helicase associated domain